MERIKLVIDNSTLREYNNFYFKKFKKRSKTPIDKPVHPSLNIWSTMSRPAANDLKNRC